MSAGVGILLGVGLLFALHQLLQALAGRLSRRKEGEPVPDPRFGGDQLIWFHSRTCAPCRAMEPVIRRLESQGRARVVDVHQELSVARAFGVMATPTTVRVRDDRILAVRSGVLAPEQLEALLGSD